MKIPLFSVIIPTCNRAQLLPSAIKSVINQVYSNWELIIIDDGSTDQTKSVVAEFQDSRIKYFYQVHQERSTARNRGIKEAIGRYICFMDDDDYYLENHLSAFFEEHEKRGFPAIILRTGFYKKKGEILMKTALYDKNRNFNPVRFAAFQFCSACTLCIPKSFLEVDQFHPKFRHWQDTHLILRLFAKHPLIQIPIYTYVYEIHPLMGSATIYQFQDAEERIDSNVHAIIDLFDHHGGLINPYLPLNTKEYLACEKYLGHANGAVVTSNIPLTLKLVNKSIKFNKRGWFIKGYIKLTLKVLFFFLLRLLTFEKS